MTKFEELLIEATKWEDEIECGVKLENVLEVRTEGNELEKDVKNSDEMSAKLSENVRVYCFPNKLIFPLFSVSSFAQIK